MKENITHGTIAFHHDITINSNGIVDIDTGFNVVGDFNKYCIIERFSGAWAFVTINKFVSDNGTLMVTVLNPTTSNISQSNAYFVYDWIRFSY